MFSLTPVDVTGSLDGKQHSM